MMTTSLLPGLESNYCELTAATPRQHPRATREKGRHYERTSLCPQCFRRFTHKGYWRHERVCKSKISAQ